MSRRNSGHSQDVYEKTNLLYSCEYVRDHQLSDDLMKVSHCWTQEEEEFAEGERKGRVKSESGGWWCLIYTLLWVSFKLPSKTAASVRQSGRRTNANLDQVEGIGWRSCASARVWICLHPINNPETSWIRIFFFADQCFPPPPAEMSSVLSSQGSDGVSNPLLVRAAQHWRRFQMEPHGTFCMETDGSS